MRFYRVIISITLLISHSLQLTSGCSAGTLIEKHEGRKSCCYLDSSEARHPTVGVGLNLDNVQVAKRLLSEVGADYDTVRNYCFNISPKQCLSEAQIDKIFSATQSTAFNDAIKVMETYGGDLSSLCCDVQNVIVDISFNLGLAKFVQFNEFIPLVIANKWVEAADDLRKTKWCGDVKSRCTEDSSYIQSGCPTSLYACDKANFRCISDPHGKYLSKELCEKSCLCQTCSNLSCCNCPGRTGPCSSGCAIFCPGDFIACCMPF